MSKALLLLLLALSGCTGMEVLITMGSWVADGIVEAETGKGIADKVVSDIAGKDCELKNVFNENEKVCKDSVEKEN
jgi:hypothetical protein